MRANIPGEWFIEPGLEIRQQVLCITLIEDTLVVVSVERLCNFACVNRFGGGVRIEAYRKCRDTFSHTGAGGNDAARINAAGEEKRKLTVASLVERFHAVVTDRMLLN